MQCQTQPETTTTSSSSTDFLISLSLTVSVYCYDRHFLIVSILFVVSFALFVCIALDRLVAVNRPYDYKQIMTVRRARFMGLICLVIGITSSIPFTKSCLTETTLDDHKHMQLLMKIYSVTVIVLATFFTGKLEIKYKYGLYKN